MKSLDFLVRPFNVKILFVPLVNFWLRGDGSSEGMPIVGTTDLIEFRCLIKFRSELGIEQLEKHLCFI